LHSGRRSVRSAHPRSNSGMYHAPGSRTGDEMVPIGTGDSRPAAVSAACLDTPFSGLECSAVRGCSGALRLVRPISVRLSACSTRLEVAWATKWFQSARATLGPLPFQPVASFPLFQASSARLSAVAQVRRGSCDRFVVCTTRWHAVGTGRRDKPVRLVVAGGPFREPHDARLAPDAAHRRVTLLNPSSVSP